MNKIRTYLSSFDILSEDEIEKFISLTKSKTMKKGELFIQEGEISKQVAFVNSGIFRSFYLSSSSEEVTYCFSFENSFIAGYSSFITQNKTSENIEAITNAELLIITRSEISRLEKSGINWLRFLKVVAESEYLKLEKRIFLLQKESAETRYQDLIENYPEYLKHIPLNLLSSYLGISQRHLSRLRKQVVF